MTSNSAKFFQYMKHIGQLKQVERTGWVRNNVKDPESVAEHMYRMAMMAFALPSDSGLDRDKCIKMALVHDMAESMVGDITPWCGVNKEEKNRREKKCELCYSDKCPETDPYCRQKCLGSCPVGFVTAGEASSSVCHPPTTTTSTTSTTTATTATTFTTNSTTTASTTTTSASLLPEIAPNRRRKRQERGASSTNTKMQMTTTPEYFCDPCAVIIKYCNVCKDFPVDGKAVCESCYSGYELKNSSCVLIPVHDTDDSGLSVADDSGLSVGAIVGIAVGGVVFLVIVILVIIFLVHFLARKD